MKTAKHTEKPIDYTNSKLNEVILKLNKFFYNRKIRRIEYHSAN